MVTADGLEGGLIYAWSARLRDALLGKARDQCGTGHEHSANLRDTPLAKGAAVLNIDLQPGRDAAYVLAEVARPRGARSWSSHLGSRLGLHFHGGDTVFGYVGPTVSPVARLALDSIGRRFAAVRLYAPATRPHSQISFPTPDHVWWHEVEQNPARQFRWTGDARISWNVQWPDVAVLEVRLPYVDQAQAGFAAQCSLRLDGKSAATRLSRGDIVAEFPVDGRNEGVVELRTPPPDGGRLANRQLGLAVPLGPEPLWEDA